MVDLPAELVTQVAEAIEDEAVRWLGRDLGTVHRDEIVRAGLLRALPMIVAAVRAEERQPEGGAALIAAERQRQIDVEGWTPEHDAEHRDAALLEAAACYLLAPYLDPAARHGHTYPRSTLFRWPWALRFWKPSPGDRLRELVKAGALIAAEIDRLLAARSEASQ